jgi:hypothetical protein
MPRISGVPGPSTRSCGRPEAVSHPLGHASRDVLCVLVPAPDIAAIAATLVLAGLAIFQLLLASGRPWGRFAWGGQHDVLPTRLRVGSLVSVLLYAAMAALLLDRAGLLDTGLADGVVTTGTWVVTGYFALGIVANLASRSRPERLVMTPLVSLLFALALVVALS